MSESESISRRQFVQQAGLAAVAAPLVASTQAVQADEPKVRKAQRICCINSAGFYMRFKVEYRKNKDGKGPEGATGETENYPNPQDRTIDLSSKDYKLITGSKIQPHVYAVWGKEEYGPQIEYAENGQTATYKVEGTTLNYSVQLK